MAILNKKEFCEIIDKIKQSEECIDSLNTTFKKYNKDIRIFDFIYEYSDILKVLKIMFNDEISEIIDYWIYDLNFGNKYSDGCITEKDGTNIVLKTAENLYDYLIEEMSKNEN